MISGQLLLIILLGLLLCAAGALLFFRKNTQQSAQDATLLQLLAKLDQQQTGLTGRLDQATLLHQQNQAQLAERLASQEKAINKMVEERLGDLTRRMGEAMHKQSTEQATTMGDLKERLAVITTAQSTITQLSQQVVSLQDILSNKQARGAFGEVQLIDLIKNALPPNIYQFQAVLGNNSRADCLLQLPNPPGKIAVDAKFPLESFHLLRNSSDEESRTRARKVFGQDVLRHIDDIAKKYIIPGETAESALMFLPSEAVYAELHAELPDIVEKSHRAHVYIVSPTTLMATLNTIRAVLKDAQMKEQAGLIQREVGRMMEDLIRLDDRVEKLDRHFNQASEDIRQIRISSEKISKRAEQIKEVELEDAHPDLLAGAARPQLPDQG